MLRHGHYYARACNTVMDYGRYREGQLAIDDLVYLVNAIKYARQLHPKAHYYVVYVKPDVKSIIDTCRWEEKDE